MNMKTNIPVSAGRSHQKNKGHGGAVNTGIAHAKGIYFKVVDSDDWVNEHAYEEIFNQLETFYRQGNHYRHVYVKLCL